MSATQPAVVNFGAAPGSVEIRERPVPEIGPEDVLLAVEAVGVCGSDLHMWTGQQSWTVNYPCVLGHEFAGRIARRGAAVPSRWREGDRVVSETHAVVDPESPLTRAGLYNLDPGRRGFGAAVDGAMTRYVRVPARILHAVPDRLAIEHAALCEPCCVAFNATAVNSRIVPGDRILVLGPGPIGVLCAAIARLGGAEVALAGLERDRIRLQQAAAYGCEILAGDPLPWSRGDDGLGAD
ncbi:MAG: alcohol dehydrogenase catalytic domain-containing protein, partial [Verrucomicrobia bacterium]|nr:alcohol dehydrogenase catalytic domain-containing protein [Verrucomicrobiota bacterium]